MFNSFKGNILYAIVNINAGSICINYFLIIKNTIKATLMMIAYLGFLLLLIIIYYFLSLYQY